LESASAESVCVQMLVVAGRGSLEVSYLAGKLLFCAQVGVVAIAKRKSPGDFPGVAQRR